MKPFYTFGAGISVRITSVTRAACAVASVVPRAAVSIDGTFARINTLFIATGQSCVAVWIHKTLIWLAASSVGITLVVLQADALGPVVLSLTDGVSTALFKEAWVLTLPADAGLVISTFKVALTSRCRKRKWLVAALLCGIKMSLLRSSQKEWGSPS